MVLARNDILKCPNLCMRPKYYGYKRDLIVAEAERGYGCRRRIITYFCCMLMIYTIGICGRIFNSCKHHTYIMLLTYQILSDSKILANTTSF